MLNIANKGCAYAMYVIVGNVVISEWLIIKMLMLNVT